MHLCVRKPDSVRRSSINVLPERRGRCHEKDPRAAMAVFKAGTPYGGEKLAALGCFL